MGATGTPTCVPPLRRGWRWTADPSLSTCQGSLLPSLMQLLHVISGREDWTWQGAGTRKRQCYSAIVAFTCSSGSSAPTLLGRLGYKDQRAKCFFVRKEKKKKIPFCRTQGCPANTEVPLLCVTEPSGRGRNVGPGLPNGKENYSNGFFTICTEHAVSQRHSYKTHNNI